MAAANPLTYALRAWRGALLSGQGPADLVVPLAVLLGLAAVGVPAATRILRRALDRARADGTLATY